MILSHDKKDSKNEPLAIALVTASPARMSASARLCGRNQHNWLLPVQSLSKLRARGGEHAFRSCLVASTRRAHLNSFRHTSCSNESQQDPIESKTIATKSLGFVRDEPGALFIEAMSLQIFARQWSASEFPEVDGSEGIVRQPCRRDSQCVPQ